MDDNIGTKLKEARLSKGISVYRIAKDLCVAEETIKRCEQGKGRMANMMKMCKYLGITLF